MQKQIPLSLAIALSLFIGTQGKFFISNDKFEAAPMLEDSAPFSYYGKSCNIEEDCFDPNDIGTASYCCAIVTVNSTLSTKTQKPFNKTTKECIFREIVNDFNPVLLFNKTTKVSYQCLNPEPINGYQYYQWCNSSDPLNNTCKDHFDIEEGGFIETCCSSRSFVYADGSTRVPSEVCLPVDWMNNVPIKFNDQSLQPQATINVTMFGVCSPLAPQEILTGPMQVLAPRACITDMDCFANGNVGTTDYDTMHEPCCANITFTPYGGETTWVTQCHDRQPMKSNPVVELQHGVVTYQCLVSPPSNGYKYLQDCHYMDPTNNTCDRTNWSGRETDACCVKRKYQYGDGTYSHTSSICIPAGFVGHAGEVLNIESFLPQANINLTLLETCEGVNPQETRGEIAHAYDNGVFSTWTSKSPIFQGLLYANGVVRNVTVEQHTSNLVLKMSANYTPIPSNDLDVFRYKDTYTNSYGRFYEENICMFDMVDSNMNTDMCLPDASIFVADFQTAAITTDGVLGLGIRGNSVGEALVWRFGNQYSVLMAQKPNDVNRLIFGSMDDSLYTGELFAYNFQLTSTQNYLVTVTGLTYSNLTFVAATGTNDITNVDMNWEVDSMIFPNKTYIALTNSFKGISGLNCSANGAGCFYNGLCYDIYPKMSSFNLTFGDGVIYSIPPESYLTEDTNALVCRVKIARAATTTSTLVLGAPWFKTFYTIFDFNNNQVDVGLASGVVGNLY